MTLARMEHSGNASPTNLQIGVTAGASSIVAVSGVGFPTGAVGPFVIVIDPDLANEEKILCSSRSTATFNVAPAGRGYDGTTPSDHSSNAKIAHVWTANEADDTSDHIYNTVTRDDHTQYLTVPRHDITARHIFGAAFAVPAAATISAVADTALPGTNAGPARADHVHGREPWAVGASSALPPATTAADGTSLSPARADHVHSRAASETFTGLTTGTLSATSISTATLSASGAVSVTGTLSAGALSAPSLSASGLTGATAASRYVGATASGAPASGTFAVGDFVVDQAGYVWVCTTAGSPGTWASEAAQATKFSARAYRTNGWALAAGALMVFDVANWDPSLCFNGTGGAGKFTCPITGYYQVSGALSTPANAAGQCMVSMMVRNGTAQTSGTFSGASSAAGQILTSSVSDLVPAVAGDVFTMGMQFNPSLIPGTTGTNFTYMAVQYVHP